VVSAPHQVSQVVPEAPRPTTPVTGEDVSTAAPAAMPSVPAATAAAVAETESRSETTVKEADAEQGDRSISLVWVESLGARSGGWCDLEID
jgi:hypothetical protein